MQSRQMARGFSLIELLIVVAVLGVLAAIALPVFSNAQDKARVSSTAASFKSLTSALQRYHAEHDGWPPDEIGGVMPDELSSYVHDLDFSKTPIGGDWDFDNLYTFPSDVFAPDGTRIGIAVALRNGDNQLYQAIDQVLDDGNLNTGGVQVLNFYGESLTYILEAR